jgi:DNA-binding MarR family transcriptional regulator
MEVLMNRDSISSSAATREDIVDILLRLSYLRRRFRGKLPEQIVNLRTSIKEHNLREKIEQINDRDVFFTIGFVFSSQSGPLTMGDLSRILGLPFSTATRTVDWLVNNSYVQRLPDPADRRVVRVELTAAGKELCGAMNDLVLESAEQLLQDFSLEERKEFSRLLGKLVDKLEQDSVLRPAQSH